METKRCTKCGEVKPLSEYYAHSGCKNGCANSCKKCQYKQQHALYLKDHEASKAYKRELYYRHREKVLATQKEYNKTHKKEIHDKTMRALYGINEIEYERLREMQNGKCAICGIHWSELDKSLCVDHNHNTGAIRGLLCYRCNLAISYLNDSRVNAFKVIEYLENYA